MNCEHCPIKGRDCIARLDPRYAHACGKAENGTLSDKAQIRALTAQRAGKPAGPPPKPVAYPSLPRQAVSFAKAAARFLVSGLVDQAEHDRRRAICEACDLYDRARNRCRKCACFLAVKPWGKAERCPEGRWAAGGGKSPAQAGSA